MISHNGKEYEKEDIYICICITESLYCPAVINATLQFNYTSIKNKLKNKGNNNMHGHDKIMVVSFRMIY